MELSEIQSNQTEIIYIAGYGRSGSTLLDVILGSHARLLGLGEIKYLFSELKTNEKLSSVWFQLYEDYKNEIKISLQESQRITDDLQNPFRVNSEKDKQDYAQIWKFIISKIQDNNSNIILVDSSKSAMDAFKRPQLLKDLGFKIKILHLIRSPRDVMQSLGKKGSNRLLEKGKTGKQAILPGGATRALLNWLWVNIGVKYYYNKKRGFEKHVIKYEDIVDDTERVLVEVTKFLNIDYNHFKNISSGQEIKTGIGISGNRMRRHETIVIRPSRTTNYSFNIIETMFLFLLKPLFRLFDY